MTEKTNLEDIIGIVKTDEPTDSVEEVRKLRGRETECERLKNENEALKKEIENNIKAFNENNHKRFKLDSEVGFIDSKRCGGDTMTYFEVVVELNKLYEENEQLKSEIKDFQELLAGKEEELLKPIIRLIDEKIEEIKQYNSELCRLTLMELRKEITE